MGNPSNQFNSLSRLAPEATALPSEYSEPCQAVLLDLLETDPAEIGRKDLGLLNLLCAPGLPGSEALDVPRCLARLDHLAGFCKASVERNLYRFPDDPDFAPGRPHGGPLGEAKWRMCLLVTNLTRDFGATYDPHVLADLRAVGDSPFVDSRNVFIHGLLDDNAKRRWGSCSSIPVLVAAVARRLGYPVKLACNRKHVYARWDDGRGGVFNVDASNDTGTMAIPPDDHYRDAFYGPPPNQRELASGMYFRSLEPHEEFSHFLKARAHGLHDNARYMETLLWSARALQFAPDWPYFSGKAYEWAELGIKHKYRQKYPDSPIPPPERNEEFFYEPGEFLRIEERSLFMTIAAHYCEYLRDLPKARRYYEEAARQNFHGHHEQRDLQRFLKKYALKCRRSIPLPPKKCGQPRRVKLSDCSPEEEYDILRRLADRFESAGELLKARDTLHDLYLFDPCDAGAFDRARAIEQRPAFQRQLRVALESQRLKQQAQRVNFQPVVQLARSI
ncbi:MAG TPA: hypothetical protein VF624_11140 [Tepidisphaeraceae bacterium]|jgi:hypothetical protein